MNLIELQRKKVKKEKISFLTCYDYWTAKIIKETSIDGVLVGDSLSMVMHGYENTLNASTSLMALHTKAVHRALIGDHQLIVVDLPFLSYSKGLFETMRNVEILMKAGAQALKLEGVEGSEKIIKHMIQSGVPIMGHIGLTPQFIHQLGGYRVQGKEEVQKKKLLQQAKILEDLGCFSIVLECIPFQLAEKITAQLKIPTIGIGAGPKTDGQILVLQDLLGMSTEFKPKFLRKYLEGFGLIKEAISQYGRDVREGKFPDLEESYSSSDRLT